MYSTLAHYFPFIKGYVSNILDNYLGITLDLEKISLFSKPSLDISNIEVHTNILNNLILSDSNIKIAKAKINHLELDIGLSQIAIRVSGIHLCVMPIHQQKNIINLNISQSLDITEEEEINKTKNEKPNPNNKKDKNLFDKILCFLSPKILVEIKDIEVLVINYEADQLNEIYANPSLSLKIPSITLKNEVEYDDKKKSNDDFDVNKKTTYNFYDNKLINISNIELYVSKSTDFNKNNFSSDENIFNFNPEKGINLYTRNNNNFVLSFGDIQSIINLLQFQLIKNLIDTYLYELSTSPMATQSKDKKKDKGKKNEIKNVNQEQQKEKDDFSFSLTVSLDSLSVIILESTCNDLEAKHNNYNPESMKKYFCYYEVNYFILQVINLQIKLNLDNFTDTTEIKIDLKEIGLSYIEYLDKLKKGENQHNNFAFEIVESNNKYKESIYEDAEEINSSENYAEAEDPFDGFKSMQEEIDPTQEQNYDYIFKDNKIIQILPISLYMMNSDIKINLSEINVNFHPVYLFKVLRFLYDNTLLLSAILLYNYKQMNYNLNKKSSSILDYDEEKINKEEVVKENKNVKDKKDIIDTQDTKDINKKDKLNINLLLNRIKISISSFCIEDDFYDYVTLFFTRFYYDCIYHMDVKDEKKITLDILSSNDNNKIIIELNEIKLNAKDDFEIIDFGINKFEVHFCNSLENNPINNDNKIKHNKLLYFPGGINVSIKEQKNINVDLKIKIKINFKLIYLYFNLVNNWMYTLYILNIFMKRMEYNSDKLNRQLYLMFNGKHKPNKTKIKSSSSNTKNIDNESIKEEANLKLCVNISSIEIALKNKNINDKQGKDNNESTFSNFVIEDGKPKYPKLKINKISVNLDLFPDPNKLSVSASISDITGEGITFEIKGILFSFNTNTTVKKLEKSSNIESSSLHDSEVDSSDSSQIKKENEQNKNNLNDDLLPNSFEEISPCKDLEEYLYKITMFEEISKIRKKINQPNTEKINKETYKETTININASIGTIALDPIDLLLYSYSVYNSIMSSIPFEKLESSFVSFNDTKLVNNSTLNNSSAYKTMEENKNIKKRIAELDNKIVSPPSHSNDKTLIHIDSSIGSIKIFFGDEKKFNLEIENISFKETEASVESISIFISHKIKNNKILKIDIFNVESINVKIINLLDKGNKNITIVFKGILLTICKDSFNYILKISEKINYLISKITFSIEQYQKMKNLGILSSESFDSILKQNDKKMEKEKKEKEIINKVDKISKSRLINSSINQKINLNINNQYLTDNSSQKLLIQKTQKREMLAPNSISLEINRIQVILFSGNDFGICYDYKKDKDKEKDKKKEKKEKKELLDDFEEVEIFEKSSRDSNIISLTIEKINLNFNYELDSIYKVLFEIYKIEINDYLSNSTFKYLIAKQKIDDSRQLLSIKVSAYKSINELSYNEYNDYNIESSISLCPITIMCHYHTLMFLINFFLPSKDYIQIDFNYLIEWDSINNLNQINQTFNLSTIENNRFNSNPNLNINMNNSELSFIDTTNNSKMEKIDKSDDSIMTKNKKNKKEKKYIFITSFVIDKISVLLNYESNGQNIKINDMTLPIPGISNYEFSLGKIDYNGYASAEDFSRVIFQKIKEKMSVPKIIVDSVKSISFAKPVTKVIESFFNIFISPYYSYKKGHGVFQGLSKGFKGFLYDLVSENFFMTEKVFRTFLFYIGVVKTNRIGKNSLYSKYFTSKEKKDYNDYFYKV